jgi:hypothetical protein
VKALALVAAGAVAAAFGQTSVLVVDSPFAPAGTVPGAAAAKEQAYELAGSSVQGGDVLVCIFDREAKRSSWIPVGGTSGPIRVISYDSFRDRVVVTIAGDRRELALRTATIASTGAAAAVERQPAPAAAPSVAPETASAAAANPAARAAHEQQEARMLVSDLLEIGMQQRKAYQEAKQKAAQAPQQPSN